MIAATTQAMAATLFRDGEGAHLLAVGDEAHQRNDREGQLHRQDHLAEHQQIGRALFAVERR